MRVSVFTAANWLLMRQLLCLVLGCSCTEMCMSQCDGIHPAAFLRCVTLARDSLRLVFCALQGTSTSIDFLNPLTATMRVVIGVPQIIGGGRFFDKEGDRVLHEGCTYEPNGVKTLY